MRRISYKSLFELERIKNLSITDNFGPCYGGAKSGSTKSSEDYIVDFFDEKKNYGYSLGSVWEFDKYAILEIDN